MHGRPKILLFFLRISLGWMFFYAGLTKILNPDWSAKGFLEGAKTFSDFYHLLAAPANITWVNFINEWGLLLIGTALILGVFARAAAWFGIVLMFLYYLPALHFPYVGESGFLVDEHIIYILALLIIIRTRAGRFFSMGSFFGRRNFE